jgi:protoporphyrinogen IX oxidase
VRNLPCVHIRGCKNLLKLHHSPRAGIERRRKEYARGCIAGLQTGWREQSMLWLKAFHVVFMVTWFAGLFYLPRLFVYHADATDTVSIERFAAMERRLFVMMTIGASLTALFGLAMLLLVPALLSFGWVQLKLVIVLLLIGYHLWCYRLMAALREGRNRHSHRWYRWFNEMPSLILIAVVILAVLKPF